MDDRTKTILTLKRKLNSLAPDGLRIKEALRLGKLMSPEDAEIARIVGEIHAYKPRATRARVQKNKFLRMQIFTRSNHCDVDLHVGAKVTDDGKCFLTIQYGFHDSRKPYTTETFEVAATWKPITLIDPLVGKKRLLLSRANPVSIPFGTSYAVQYAGGNFGIRSGTAVQCELGGPMKLARTYKAGVRIAEELFREQFAKMAGV